MSKRQLVDVLEQLKLDCESDKFLPYAEGDLRAEAYARLKEAVHGSELVVNTEVRFNPLGGDQRATKCDVVAWRKWGREEKAWDLKNRTPTLAVEFKYWGVSGPDKMRSAFEADIARLAEFVPRGRGVAFLYVARRFENLDRVLKAARSLGKRHSVRTIVANGTGKADQ